MVKISRLKKNECVCSSYVHSYADVAVVQFHLCYACTYACVNCENQAY